MHSTQRLLLTYLFSVVLVHRAELRQQVMAAEAAEVSEVPEDLENSTSRTAWPRSRLTRLQRVEPLVLADLVELERLARRLAEPQATEEQASMDVAAAAAEVAEAEDLLLQARLAVPAVLAAQEATESSYS